MFGREQHHDQGVVTVLEFVILWVYWNVIKRKSYTNKIDKLTYCLDEVGFSIVQTFATTRR